MFFRTLKQIPLIYSTFILVLTMGLVYVLVLITIPVTLKSVLIAVFVHIFLCHSVRYRNEKVLLLKQYKNALSSAYIIDFLLIAVPFFLLNPVFGAVACVTAVLYGMFRAKSLRKPRVSLVVPSPFFVKSSYLWHAQMRYLLPFAWISIIAFIIIGRLHDNPNLAFVAFVGGTFLACFVTVFQSEKADFVQIYISEQRFLRQTLIETVFNTLIFVLPSAIAMLVLFSEKWWAVLLAIASITALNVNVLWIKYAFYPSQMLSFVLFLLSLFFLGALATTIYGLLLVPIYYAFLFRLCKKNTRKLLMNYERADN